MDGADRMHFRRMDEGSDADFAVLAGVHAENVAALPDLLMGMLTDLKADAKYPVDRCEHSLQAATRAWRDGRDEEYVVCALLHDIGESLGPFNHGDIVAAVLRPFVSEANQWMVEKHGIFQGYYFFHHLGMNRDAREEFRGHQWFDRTARFCELYDGPAFDPKGEILAVEYFEPMVRRVFAAPRQTLYTAFTDDEAAREPRSRTG